MRIVDPNHYTEYTSSGSYWASIAKSTSKLGITRAVNEADLESSNPVMVW
ncbi:hypothetical protein [Kurthia sibirica]|nr:hypothetical protein [Kurthia sibirica]GEK35396.1 hypothetical protein KSI01_29290 [Kurthia sibirica]